MPRPNNRAAKTPKTFVLLKPKGELTQRVKKVGPEHFGIVAVDCAKARSRLMLADFFGQTLIKPMTVPHTQGHLQAAIDCIRQAMRQHDLRDIVVAIERTGEYHLPVQQAFRQANFETRLVHPFTSKQFRQPADPNNKTDDTDVAAIFRATTQGFGLAEPTWPDLYVQLHLLCRHRRDLVMKNTILCCQIREVLHAAMPGYAECFAALWQAPTAMTLARLTTSAQAIREAGLPGLQNLAAQANIVCQQATLHKVLAWAEQAPPAHPRRLELRRILQNLDDDRLTKTQQILELERSLAHLVVHTPYALLLVIPGINLVTIADLAGELGPIEFYLNANAITGRAGLMPSRYQSDLVDCSGPLRRRGHRRIRAALMQTADNLVHCNHYFRARAEQWRRLGKDARWLRVKVAKIFSRLAFAIVAGRQLFPHPCRQADHYVLGKLLAFHVQHRTDPALMRQDLEAVIEQLPNKARADEAQRLQACLDELAKRRRGLQPLANILPLVLARLQQRMVQSNQGAGT